MNRGEGHALLSVKELIAGRGYENRASLPARAHAYIVYIYADRLTTGKDMIR